MGYFPYGPQRGPIKQVAQDNIENIRTMNKKYIKKYIILSLLLPKFTLGEPLKHQEGKNNEITKNYLTEGNLFSLAIFVFKQNTYR